MKKMMEDLSNSHTKDIIISCQETWRFDLPQQFRKEFSNNYNIIHESAMNKNIARKRGRPYGGVCFIISKSIAFTTVYTYSRCWSILLTDQNILLNDIYIPYDDSRKTTEKISKI